MKSHKFGDQMMAGKERTLPSEINDKLIELYVEQDEAKAADDFGRICELHIDIRGLEIRRAELRNWRSRHGQCKRAHGATALARQSHHQRVAKGVHAPETVVEGEPALQSPTTSTGLPVEDQVRKKWDSDKGGLPIFY
jgi:hypothetical protein